MHSLHPRKRSRGVALVVVMVCLVVLTLVALTAAKRSGTDMKISANQADEFRAFSNSEAGRAMIRGLLVDHADNDGVWTNVAFPSGVMSTSDGANLLANSEQSSLTPNQMMAALRDLNDCALSSLDTDLRVRYDGDADDSITDGTGEPDIFADIKVVKLSLGGLTPGTGGAQVEGYSGIGQGAASAGAGYVYFDIRSIGHYGDARAVTGSDFRIRR